MCRWELFAFFFSSRRRHTRFDCDWSSDVCSSDLKRRRGSREPSWRVDERHGGIPVAPRVVAGNRLIRWMLDRDDARERIYPEQGDEPRRVPTRVPRGRRRPPPPPRGGAVLRTAALPPG